MRMHMRRFTRLTNAFSKKFDAHIHALSLYFTFYNFVRMHKTLRMSPAMAAGCRIMLWSMEDIVALIDTRDSARRSAVLQEKGGSLTRGVFRERRFDAHAFEAHRSKHPLMHLSYKLNSEVAALRFRLERRA